ncbi:MAG: hypothetical protein WA208_09395, partial [Thermoanaerobaculia bacterium]
MPNALVLHPPDEATRTIGRRTMGTARDLKRRADTFLEDLFRALFEEIDTDKLRKEIEALKASSPDFRPVEHARVLARRTALRCAAAGAVTGIPAG